MASVTEGSREGRSVALGSGEAGCEGGRGILVLGDTGQEADQFEIGMDGTEARAGGGGAREATAASMSAWVAGGSSDGGEQRKQIVS